MKKSRILAVVLMLAMVVTMFAACSNSDDNQGTGNGGQEQNDNGGGEATGKVFRTYMGTDVRTLNTHDNVDTNPSTPIEYTNSTLWRTVADDDGMGFHFIGDIATDLPTQLPDDPLTWEIHLRQDAKWQNGDPITADDFIYSWQMQIDPTLVNSMANFLYYSVPITNAEAYFNGECSWEDVGIKKIDDYTIQIHSDTEVTQNDFCTNFIDRSVYPVHKATYEAGMNDDRTETSYGIDLDSYMGCGPYIFDTWTRDSVQVYKKNPDHWLADLFNYDTVEIYIIPEMNAAVQMFESGELDYLAPDANTLDTYLDDPRMLVTPSLYVLHLDVNCKNTDNPIAESVNYRRALYYALDRDTMAEEIFGHSQPAVAYINGQAGVLSDSGIPYRETPQGKSVVDKINESGPSGYNPELALEYLNKAYEECGVPEDQVITLKFGVDASDQTWRAAAEYMAEQFPQIFDGKLQIEIVSYSGISTTEFKAGNDTGWDLTNNDWGRALSRNYPYVAFFYFLSTYEGGPNNYYSERLEEQYAKCEEIQLNGTYEELLDATAELELINYEDCVMIPVIQGVSYEMYAENIQLPVKQYIPGFGWGDKYGDIVG